MSRRRLFLTSLVVLALTTIYFLSVTHYDVNGSLPGQEVPLSHNVSQGVRLDYLVSIERQLQDGIDRRMVEVDVCAKREIRRIETLLKTGNTSLLSVDISSGRLGNLMFQAASLAGIARHTGRVPYFTVQDARFKLFHRFWIPNKPSDTFFQQFRHNSQHVVHVAEQASGIFAPNVYDLSRELDGKTVAIGGYIQSFKYFQAVQSDIKCLLTFRRDIYQLAADILNAKLLVHTAHYPHEPWSSRPSLVGIHVRRGDFIAADSPADGRIPAPTDYLARAVDEMRRRHKTVLFVVASDDVAYCRGVFQGPKFTVMKANAPEVDMAMMHLMDYFVMSSGTFGWWAAYAGQARETVYFRDWPKNGTSMRGQYKNEDFFPPEWTGLS